MKPPTEKPKLAKLAFKARRMFVCAATFPPQRKSSFVATIARYKAFALDKPVLVLPADAASVEALVEKIALDRHSQCRLIRWNKKYTREQMLARMLEDKRAEARAALVALGFKIGGRK